MSDCVAIPSVTIGTVETVHSPTVGASVTALPDVDGTVGSVAAGAVDDESSGEVPDVSVSSPPAQAAATSASTLIAASNRRCAITPLDLPRVRIGRRQESAGSSFPIVRLHSATPQERRSGPAILGRRNVRSLLGSDNLSGSMMSAEQESARERVRESAQYG
jgi:hypothetical protein